MKGFGRPVEFSGKEEDSQQVVEEDGGILCGCAQGVSDDVGVVS